MSRAPLGDGPDAVVPVLDDGDDGDEGDGRRVDDVHTRMSSFGGEPVKSTWVTRRVPAGTPVAWDALRSPEAGHVLLCEVIRTGLHGRVETAIGSRAKLYAGDRIVCVVANRYATSLLEAVAEVGEDRADMVTASGICGTVVTRARKATPPTRLRPLAQAFLDGRSMTLRSFALGVPGPAICEPRWVVVVGSAMDSGKTTACVSLIRGLVDAGNRVGAIKVTGSASGRDFGSFRDAGAYPVLDFLDAGWASTAGCSEREVSGILDGLTGHLRAAGVDWGVIEIADGLLQPETSLLLESLEQHLGPAEIVLTVGESLAAVAGIERLASYGLRVGAVSGLLTNSPLACREVELECAASCVSTPELGRRLAEGTLSLSPASTTTGPVAGTLRAATS